MKKLLTVLVAVFMAVATSVQAQEIVPKEYYSDDYWFESEIAIDIDAEFDVEIDTISFVNEIGCEYRYHVNELADIIVTSDTLVDEEADTLMYQYEEEYPSELGPDEPAVAVLVPDHEFFNVIFIQETEDDDILKIRILTDEGWLECVADPGDENLLNLATMIIYIQHMNEVGW